MPTTFSNTIDGNEILAKRSQCDYAGNDIQTTYATKSELPTATSDLTNDSGFITLSDVPAQANADWNATSGVSEILNKPDLSIYAESSDLATVATSGSYNDLLDKPSIPSAQVNADWDATSGVSEILNKPNLATVATTGDYSDLQNLPSIPAAQVNSDWSATSGVSQILNKPSIPTATSDLTNDSGFITLSDVPAQVNADWNASSGVSEILNKPTIPSGAQLVPSATSADASKVLTVNAQGTPAWANSSGGNEVYVTWDDTSAGWSSMWTQVQAALSANKEVYIKDGFCVAEVIGVYDGQVNFRGLSDNHFGSPPKMTYNYYTIQQGFAYKEVHAQYVLPNPSSGSVGQVLGLVSSEDPPYSEPAWVDSSGGGGSQVNSDWDATSGVAEILNKPTPKTLTAGTGISISEGVGTITISSNVTAPVQDVTVDGTSVVSNGVAAITSPTVDQTYDATSANAQSGVAVASGISDAVAALPTNLSSAQIQSLKEALGVDETVLYNTNDYYGSATLNLSEPFTNFKRLKVLAVRANSDQSTPYSFSGPWCEFETEGITIGKGQAFGSLTPWLFENKFWKVAVYQASDTTTFTWSSGLQKDMTSTSAASMDSSQHSVQIKTVIGIHRIASN